jgi:transposase InsO family protein
VNVYPFIEAEQAGRRNVSKACALLEVSRAAYYQWGQHIECAREREDQALAERIRTIHMDSKGTYGAPRVHAELRKEGVRVSRKRVGRLMRMRKLVGRCRRRFKRTTVPDPEAGTVAADLLQRCFSTAAFAVNQAWCGDITYVRTWEGWLFVATVIDLASRRVVGWAMADHMRAELVTDALEMAIASRKPGKGTIFHSDRGSQYTSGDFRKVLGKAKMRQSLSRPGQCWDNAVAESWFATLKDELIYRHTWPTRARARQAIFEYIEGFYNRRRLHSSLDYLTPAEYEARQVSQSPTAPAA